MNGVGDAIGGLVFGLIALCIVFVPLGAWKAFELVQVLFSHIQWK